MYTGGMKINHVVGKGVNKMDNKVIIDDKEIIYILKNRKRLLDIIQKKIQSAYDNIESLDEIVGRISGGGISYGERTSSGCCTEGLFKVLMKRDAEHKKQMQEYEQTLYHLMQEEEKIHTIFKGLTTLSSADYELLDTLYVQDMTWEVYAIENDISVATLGRRKRKALTALKRALAG
jgi:hypothetical protein